jgi:calcineurin-like phosphoesterase family protein
LAIYFTADTHFGHGGALGLYRRPFASVPEMDAAMIAQWNETVESGDEVWHLGDFALRVPLARAAHLLSALHGRKHLLIGNNDPPQIVALSGWTTARHYAEVQLGNTRLVLCHYAFRSWNGMARGAVNLHGHSHGRLKPMPRQVDVGVDVWGFRPVAVSRILESKASAAAFCDLPKKK